MLLYFRDKFRLNGRTTFSKSELSLLLSIYGARVQRGEWRDYAIDSLPDMAVFSVFRSSQEQPLYAISKVSSRSLVRPSEYVVCSGNKTLKQSTSLSDIVDFFEGQA